MGEIDENAIRKQIWERKAAVDAKMAESGFGALPLSERDAWVLSLMLDLPFDVSVRFVIGSPQAGERASVRAKADDLFKYGKRSALRALKDVLARQGSAAYANGL